MQRDTTQKPISSPPTVVMRDPRVIPSRQRSWLEERLDLEGLNKKYGRKAFPVHTTFFLGEMTLFSFVILIVTGVYLALLYAPSNAEITVGSDKLPEAYASVQLIESIAVANIFRNVHHWSAHLMIAAMILHALRIFFFGSYRKPRELNWIMGVVLLGVTLVAAFVGYSLPYDSFAVVATGVGFGLAQSIPWVGGIASDLFFGGAFPTLGSIPRLYTIHVLVLPAIIGGLTAAHLLLVIKQKHTQPGYARKLSEPGKVLGVPLMPYQAILAVQLLLFMFGGLFILSALLPVHPLAAYGPPGPGTGDVKADWYLLWVFGFLKLIPSSWKFSVLGGTFGPEFFGGILFPALVFGVMTFAPFVDKTNRRVFKRYEYLEPPRQGPVRLGIGSGVLALIGTNFLAAYYDQLGIPLLAMWAITIIVPVAVGIAAWAIAKGGASSRPYFDPTGIDENLPMSMAEPALRQSVAFQNGE